MAGTMSGEGAAAQDVAATALTAPTQAATAPDVTPTAPASSTAASAAPAAFPEAVKPPPPPPPPSRERERSRSPRSGGLFPDGFEGKRSRFMLGPSGEVLHKWRVDYATRGGGGRAQCRQGVNCLHKDGHGTLIEKGSLRVGRRVVMKDQHGEEGAEELKIYWSHAKCLFHGFTRSRDDTRVITYEEDMDGFQELIIEDQNFLRREIRVLHGERGGEIPPQKRHDGGAYGGGGSGAGGSSSTPVRRPSLLTGSVEKEPRIGGIKRSFDGTPLLAEGDRVWAFFKEGTMRIKSKKSELGIIRGMQRDTALVQFESSEEQTARLERFATARSGKGWLRHPHSFGGPKQHLPKKWLDLKRPVPLLCGCAKQKDGHGTTSGCSCTPRGMRNLVCGLDIV